MMKHAAGWIGLLAGIGISNGLQGAPVPSEGEEAMTLDWVAQGGGAAHDKWRGLAVTSTGLSRVTGEFTGRARFGEQAIESFGGLDALVAGYDERGECRWLARGGGDKTDRGYGVAVDAKGDVYATGHFESPTFRWDGMSVTNAGSYDVWVVKLDAGGRLLWLRRAGGAGYDYGHGMALWRDGCVVAGALRGEADFDGKHRAGGRGLFAAAYDGTGNLQWVFEPAIGSRSSGHQIATDATGQVFVCGYLAGRTVLGAHEVEAGTVQEIYVMRLSAAGKPDWVAVTSGGANGLATGVAPDDRGGCYIVGMFQGTPAFGDNRMESRGKHDLYVAHVAASGTWDWVRRVGGEGIDYGLGITSDPQGGCFFTGETTGAVDFLGEGLPGIGQRDLYVARLTDGGVLSWVRPLGGTRTALSYAVGTDGQGGCWTAGAFSGGLQAGDGKWESLGSNDAVLIRWKPAGK